MPQTKSQRPNTFFDDFGALPNGCNAGVEVLLLPQSQAAFATNSTFRGGYICARPPYRRQTFNFGGDADLEEAFTKGFFQGAAAYRPDFGQTQIIVQASGRLFRLTNVSGSWLVEEITIPSDPNDSGQPRAWMWQSEKWLIINDGSVRLPIIYDGVVARRSYGPSVLLGTVTSAPSPFPNPRVIGEVIEVVLTSPYTGAFNVPVIFNGHFYQTRESQTFYPAVLKNNGSSRVDPIPVGATVFISSNIIATTTGTVVPTGQPWHGGTTGVSGNPFFSPTDNSDAHYYPTGVPLPDPDPNLVPADTTFTLQTLGEINAEVGTTVVVPSKFANAVGTSGIGAGGYTLAPMQCTVVSKTTTSVTLKTIIAVSPQTLINTGNRRLFPVIVDGGSITLSTGTIITEIGTLIDPFTVPALAASGTVHLSLPYSGPDNQSVGITFVENGFATTENSFIISKSPTPGLSSTIFLLNLTDTTDAGAAIPTGSPAGDILSMPELPAGRMGAYIQQRNVMSLVDGLGFIVGDIAGGAAGTQAENYRDAVLKTTENDFLVGGGTFRVPSSGNIITAIVATANLDRAFGQGEGQIGTDTGMWGLNLPVDRTTWAALTTPLLPASLIGYGPLAQLSTILSNSDVIFRQVDGIASLKFARRDFNEDIGGNTPISREVSNVLDADNKDLLAYSSAITHDNRLLMTAGPLITGRGVIHRGLVALNFDLVSSLRGKAPPIYDGLWTGLNLFQAITGNFSGVTKSYALGWHQVDDVIELFELLPTGAARQDNDDTRIVWSVESPPLFRPDGRPKEQRLVRLLNGQLHVRDVAGLVNVTVQWRPDFSPCWQDWHSFEICANVNVTDGQPGYRTPIGLGEPPPTACETANNRPYRVGRFFQVRIEVTGSCKIMGFEASAMYEPEDAFVAPLCEPVSAQESELLIPAPS